MSESSNIYRWNRITKPSRTYSRSQRVTSTEDVQDWIKKVEQASNNAAAATFGAKYGSKGQGHREAQVTLDLVHQHDAAYSEAQDLLKEWVSDKLNFDADDDDSFTERAWPKTSSDVKREWDNLVDLEDYGIEDDGTLRALKHKVAAADVYTAAEAQDEREIVDDILQHMMEKEVVTETVINDLGLDEDKGRVDPSVKMKLRHQQVKENREKRNKIKEEKFREQQRKKEAQLKAKQILLKEEREKATKKKQEEEEIQKEMTRIRKELQEEKKQQEERQRRQRKLQEEEDQKIAEDISAQQRELQSYRETHQKEAERRRREETVSQKIRNREMKNNYKILHKHFLAWYDIIIHKRLQLGKACAMADWRCLLRSWNAWRAYTRNRTVEKEALEHEYYIKTYHRKVLLADNKYKETLLKKTFVAWQVFMQQEAGERKDTHTKELTRTKMAAFLQAAATGQLWEREEDSCATDRAKGSIHKKRNPSATSSRSDITTDSARMIVDDMFADGSKATSKLNNEVERLTPLALTDRSDITVATDDQLPTQPWQITRKHLKLTKEQIATLTQNTAAQTPESTTSNQSQTRSRKKTWERAPPTPNNFEHRHSAQQRMLMEQQRQIREQQRLIQDLQYVQKQQALTQTIAQQQELQEQLKKMAEETLRNAQIEMSKQDSSVQKNDNKDTGSTDEKQNYSKTVLNGMDTERSDVLTPASTTRGRTSSTPSLSARDNKHLKFVKSMEERAAERARLKQEREERKHRMEQQKLLQIQAEEEEKRAQEEEDKRREREAYRERKRLEKQREIEKQQWELRVKELTVIANAHYHKKLLRLRGWIPWQRLIENKHQKIGKAEQHYKNRLLRKVLLCWHDDARQATEEKERVADKMRQYLLTQRCFRCWRKFGHYMVIQEEKAVRHYQRHLLGKLIRNWADYTTTEQISGWEKERRAKEHNTWRIQRNALRIWQRYPQQRKAEEEREKRKEQMRKKVASMLPDFQGFSLSS